MFLILILYPGPLRISDVTFDIHTMFFGMVFTLAGVQIIITGLFAKIFSYTERFSPEEFNLERYLKRFTLEKGLIIGCIIGFFGLAGDIYVFIKWAKTDFGNFDQLRLLVLYSTFFLMGVQVIFSSFFLSMLGISRDTYIGDYEKKAGNR
jgi:hypothetical protein